MRLFIMDTLEKQLKDLKPGVEITFLSSSNELIEVTAREEFYFINGEKYLLEEAIITLYNLIN